MWQLLQSLLLWAGRSSSGDDDAPVYPPSRMSIVDLTITMEIEDPTASMTMTRS